MTTPTSVTATVMEATMEMEMDTDTVHNKAKAKAICQESAIVAPGPRLNHTVIEMRNSLSASESGYVTLRQRSITATTQMVHLVLTMLLANLPTIENTVILPNFC